jgi:hypothetical protein
MLQIRPYTESDIPALRRLHAAQNFDYPFPDLHNPLFLTKLVLTNNASSEAPGDAGQGIIAAALLRLTAEAYLLLDPKQGTPRDRWNNLLVLHAATEREAAQRGLEDVHAWLPPQITKQFGRRLTDLGWQRDDRYTPFCKRLSI